MEKPSISNSGIADLDLEAEPKTAVSSATPYSADSANASPFVVDDSCMDDEGASKPAPKWRMPVHDDTTTPTTAAGDSETEKDKPKKKGCLDFRLPLWVRYIGYLLVIVYIFGSSFVILVYGMKFDLMNEADPAQQTINPETGKPDSVPDRSSGVALTWITASVISTLMDVFVNQPLGVVCATLFHVFIGPQLCEGAFDLVSQ